MAKLFITAVLLSVYCAVLVKGLSKDEAVANFVAKVKDCQQEIEARDSDVEEVLGKGPASTMEGKCLRACILKKYEAMDDNGKLDKNVLFKHFEQIDDATDAKLKIIAEILNKCGAIKVSTNNHCEAAEEYYKCFKEEHMAYNEQ